MKTKRPPTVSVSVRLKPDEMKLLREAAGAVRIDLYATDVLRRHLTGKLVDEALEAIEFPETAHIPAREYGTTQETGLTPELYDWLGNQLHDDFAYKLWRLLEAFRAGETMPRRGV